MVRPIFILISVLMFIFIVVPPFLISKYSNMKGSASFFRDDDEYKRLKPILTPPNKVFSIVWPILYVLMAISIMCATLPFLYNLIQNNNVDSNWVSVLFTVIFFCAQLCLNWAWVPLFIQKRYKTTFIFSILMINILNYIDLFHKPLFFAFAIEKVTWKNHQVKWCRDTSC